MPTNLLRAPGVLDPAPPTSDLEMDSLIGMINARIISMHESNRRSNLAYSIGTEQVFNAIRKLKNDKR